MNLRHYAAFLIRLLTVPLSFVRASSCYSQAKASSELRRWLRFVSQEVLLCRRTRCTPNTPGQSTWKPRTGQASLGGGNRGTFTSRSFGGCRRIRRKLPSQQPSSFVSQLVKETLLIGGGASASHCAFQQRDSMEKPVHQAVANLSFCVPREEDADAINLSKVKFKFGQRRCSRR